MGIALLNVRKLFFISSLLPWNNSDDIFLPGNSKLPSFTADHGEKNNALSGGSSWSLPRSTPKQGGLTSFRMWAVQGYPCVVCGAALLLKAHRGGVQEREALLLLPLHFPLSCHLLFFSKCFSLSPHSATGNLSYSTFFCLVACGQVYLPCVL